MSTKPEFVERVLEQLDPLEIVAKPMFGEYGLYFKGKFFGFICDDTVFIKVTPAGNELAGRIVKSPPYPGGKPAFKISKMKLADKAWMKKMVEIAAKNLPDSKVKKKSGI